MEQLLKMFKKFFVKSIVVALLLSLSFGVSLSVFATEIGVTQVESTTGNNGTQPTSATEIPVPSSSGSGVDSGTGQQGNQAYDSSTGNTNPNNKSGNQSQNILSAGTNAVSCAAGGVVSGLLSNFISSTINPDHYTKLNNVNTSDDRHSGNSQGIIPSADSIAYCVINAMIQYIADATIQWINSGFDGNPAFVKDPKQFFTDLGDQAAAGFIRDVVGGATGINVCQPFRVDIATGLGAGSGNSVGNDFGSRSQCTLGDIASNAQNFQVYTSGNSPQSGNFDTFYNMSQNDQNNPYGVYFMAQQELSRRVALQQNTAHVDMTSGNGFLSIKKCSDDTTETDSSGVTHTVKGACGYTTPGHMIENAANSKLQAGDQRLVLADKFDQVVSTLINQLIKTALSELLKSTSK